jgi:hypothetical protein
MTVYQASSFEDNAGDLRLYDLWAFLQASAKIILFWMQFAKFPVVSPFIRIPPRTYTAFDDSSDGSKDFRTSITFRNPI